MAITQIYAADVSGADYSSVPTNAKSSGAKDNGGAVTRGGTVASGKLDNVDVSRYDAGVFGSTVLDNGVADKAVDAGIFANNTQVPIAPRITNMLGGVENDVLISGANVPSLTRSIHKLETLRSRRFTTAIRQNKYNRVTNTWEAGYPVVAVDSLAVDGAATPSRDVPGSVVYKLGNSVPVSANYKPKTS